MPIRLLLTFFAVLFVAAPASAKERNLVMGGFERLVVEGDIVVNVTTGSSPGASADGTQEQLDRVQFNRAGTTLTVRLLSPVRTGRRDVADGGPLRVTLSTRKLSQLVLRGNGRVTADALDDRSVRVMMTGNGLIDIGRVTADQLYVNAVGAGTIAMDGGTVREGQVQLDGAASWQASGLTLDRLVLTHSGPANSAVAVEEFAKVQNNGLGTIAIGGDATCDIRTTGSAQISCGNGKDLRQAGR